MTHDMVELMTCKPFAMFRVALFSFFALITLAATPLKSIYGFTNSKGLLFVLLRERIKSNTPLLYKYNNNFELDEGNPDLTGLWSFYVPPRPIPFKKMRINSLDI